MSSRYENLLAILHSFDARGIQYREVDGELRLRDTHSRLSDGERVGIQICRKSLTEAYRRAQGLCIACGLDAAKRPSAKGYVTASNLQTRAVISVPADAPEHLRRKYPPLWCDTCWNGGRWKDGLELEKHDADSTGGQECRSAAETETLF